MRELQRFLSCMAFSVYEVVRVACQSRSGLDYRQSLTDINSITDLQTHCSLVNALFDRLYQTVFGRYLCSGTGFLHLQRTLQSEEGASNLGSVMSLILYLLFL